MNNFIYDYEYIFKISKLHKKMRSYYLNVYKNLSEEQRIQVHLIKTKLSVSNKNICVVGKESEFHYSLFLLAIIIVHKQTVNLESIILSEQVVTELFDKKSILKNIFIDIVTEKRGQGMSWRNISRFLNDAYQFKISHNYLKNLYLYN